MPLRKIPLITNEIYHIVNRGNASSPIFKTKWDHRRFIKTFWYYQLGDPPMRFSKLLDLSQQERKKLIKKQRKEEKPLVGIIAYCLMPNHFHLLLKQARDSGILKFMELFANSYSRYFNTKYQRKGSLFEGRFKAIRLETDSQLLHLSRYIHLNPYSSFLVKSINELSDYHFSSFPEYLGLSKNNICQKEIVLSFFPKPEDYKKFVSERANYQKSLEEIKHQLLED